MHDPPIGFYSILRCTRDLTVVQIDHALTWKKAHAIAANNLKQYGQGSMIYYFWRLYTCWGPLGYQTEGPASFQGK